MNARLDRALQNACDAYTRVLEPKLNAKELKREICETFRHDSRLEVTASDRRPLTVPDERATNAREREFETGDGRRTGWGRKEEEDDEETAQLFALHYYCRNKILRTAVHCTLVVFANCKGQRDLVPPMYSSPIDETLSVSFFERIFSTCTFAFATPGFGIGDVITQNISAPLTQDYLDSTHKKGCTVQVESGCGAPFASEERDGTDGRGDGRRTATTAFPFVDSDRQIVYAIFNGKRAAGASPSTSGSSQTPSSPHRQPPPVDKNSLFFVLRKPRLWLTEGGENATGGDGDEETARVVPRGLKRYVTERYFSNSPRYRLSDNRPGREDEEEYVFTGLASPQMIRKDPLLAVWWHNAPVEPAPNHLASMLFFGDFKKTYNYVYGRIRNILEPSRYPYLRIYLNVIIEPHRIVAINRSFLGTVRDKLSVACFENPKRVITKAARDEDDNLRAWTPACFAFGLPITHVGVGQGTFSVV